MYSRLLLGAVIFCIALISACDMPSESKVPSATQSEQMNQITSTVMGSTTGVPSAESVFPNPTTALPAPPAGRPSGRMTTDQESRGMPIPGQNNDHSAPKATEKP